MRYIGNVVHQLTPPRVDGVNSSQKRGVISLTAPTGFSGIPGDTQVILSWNSVAGATSYEIETDGGVPVNIGNLIGQTITSLTNNQSYAFRVRARASTVTSPWSNTINVTPVSSVSPNSFSESFEAPLTSPWYDTAQTLGFLTGPNPNGGIAYRYPWTAGQQFAPVAQTARRKFITASDEFEARFQSWGDAAFVKADGDHLFYVRLNTSSDTAGPASGFTLYVEPLASGQIQVQWRTTGGVFNGTTHTETVGAPSFYGTTPRNYRVAAKMNTFGQADGTLEFWVDDIKYITKTNCVFRDGSAAEKFQQFIIGPHATLAQTSSVNYYFDNLVVTDSIGSFSNVISFNMNLSGPGRIRFWQDHSWLSASGTHNIFVSRDFGSQGAISVTVTTFEIYGNTFTPLNVIVSWADGESGVKLVQHHITKTSLGQHRAGVLLSNPVNITTPASPPALHNGVDNTIMDLVIDDGTVAPDADSIHFNAGAAGGGNGTAASPFNNFDTAVLALDASAQKRWLYCEGVTIPAFSQNIGGQGLADSMRVPQGGASRSTMKFVSKLPGGVGFVVDGNAPTKTNSNGFYATQRSNLCFFGIDFIDIDNTSVGGTFGAENGCIFIDDDTNSSFHIISEFCTIDGQNSKTNNSGIAMWGVFYYSIYNCSGNNITVNGGLNLNGSFAETYDGQYGFVSFCTVTNCRGGVFQKRLEGIFIPSVSVSFCLFIGCSGGVYRSSGSSGAGHSYFVFSYNVCKNTAGDLAIEGTLQIITINNAAIGEKSQIFHNIFHSTGVGEQGSIVFRNQNNIQLTGNIFKDCTGGWRETANVANTVIELADRNLYDNVGGADYEVSAVDYPLKTNIVSANPHEGVNLAVNDVVATIGFQDSANDDYRNVPGSAALGSANNGYDMGPYINSVASSYIPQIGKAA